jgi:hypothetical protein
MAKVVCMIRFTGAVSLACLALALCGCPSSNSATREGDAERAANRAVREMERETRK